VQSQNHNVRHVDITSYPSLPKSSKPTQTTSRKGTNKMNHMYIVGRIGRDPELRFATSGNAVANFSVAVTRKPNGQEETTWFDCVSFGEQAENYCNDFVKGSRVIVIGRIEIKEYTGKDGVEKKKTQIVVDEAGLSSRWKKSNGSNSEDIATLKNSFPEIEEPF
jgi:single-strand DNA-binding protein